MEEKEIKLLCGDTLETAYKVLLANAPAYCSFNGVRLTSSDSLEDMYKKVTGHTKEEIDAIYQKQQEERKRKEKEFEEKKPELIKEYQKKARGVIPEDRLELWDRIVPVRLDDLYHGMELDCWLELIEVLNDTNLSYNVKMTKGKDIFDKQGHSGMSGNLVMSGLKEFHPLGNDLVDFIKKAFEE